MVHDKKRRNRIPKLSRKPDASGRYCISFRDAHGKPCRVRFQRTRDESERDYRRWIRANYGRDREEAAEPPSEKAASEPEIGTTLKAIIAAYIAAEHQRVRTDDAERTQGTVGIAEYWDIRHQALKIGLWAKEHFGNRFETVAFGSLMDIADYDAMMLHFIQNLRYAKTRVNKIRRRFWDMVRFAKGRPFRQQLPFLRDEVKKYGGGEKKRERDIPSVEVIRKVLATADTEERAWIWLAVGCAFGQDDLSKCRPLHFDTESYDLRRGKTGVERYGTMRPMAWSHLRRFLAANPRKPDDLLFVTRTGKADRPQTHEDSRGAQVRNGYPRAEEHPVHQDRCGVSGVDQAAPPRKGRVERGFLHLAASGLVRPSPTGRV